MKLKRVLWALGLACVFARPAYSALIAPTLNVSVDGYGYNIPINYSDADHKWYVDNYAMNLPEASMMISAAIDQDPSIAYGISVTDFGAPSSFSFTFTSPIVPTGSPNVVTASLVGGLTDATGNGISMTPTQADLDGDGLLELQTSSVGLGGPTTNMGVDVGPAFTAPPGAPGALHNYLSTVAGPKPGPGPGPFDTISTTLAFGLSGDGDIASMTGFASIEVPEPGILGLVLAGVPMLMRRRK